MADNFLNDFCVPMYENEDGALPAGLPSYALLLAAGFFICRGLNRRSHTGAWYQVLCFVCFFLRCGSSGSWRRFDLYRWRDA